MASREPATEEMIVRWEKISGTLRLILRNDSSDNAVVARKFTEIVGEVHDAVSVDQGKELYHLVWGLFEDVLVVDFDELEKKAGIDLLSSTWDFFGKLKATLKKCDALLDYLNKCYYKKMRALRNNPLASNCLTRTCPLLPIAQLGLFVFRVLLVGRNSVEVARAFLEAVSRSRERGSPTDIPKNIGEMFWEISFDSYTGEPDSTLYVDFVEKPYLDELESVIKKLKAEAKRNARDIIEKEKLLAKELVPHSVDKISALLTAALGNQSMDDFFSQFVTALAEKEFPALKMILQSAREAGLDEAGEARLVSTFQEWVDGQIREHVQEARHGEDLEDSIDALDVEFEEMIRQHISPVEDNPFSRAMGTVISRIKGELLPPPPKAREGNGDVISSDWYVNAASTYVVEDGFDDMVRQLEAMGFTREACIRALRAAFNNPDRAIEYLL